MSPCPPPCPHNAPPHPRYAPALPPYARKKNLKFSHTSQIAKFAKMQLAHTAPPSRKFAPPLLRKLLSKPRRWNPQSEKLPPSVHGIRGMQKGKQMSVRKSKSPYSKSAQSKFRPPRPHLATVRELKKIGDVIPSPAQNQSRISPRQKLFRERLDMIQGNQTEEK